MGLFLGYFSLISTSFFLLIRYCLDYCTLIISLEIRLYNSSNFVLFQNCFDYFEILCISTGILEPACQFLQIACWDFYWDWIKSIEQFGENWYLTTRSLSVHERGMSLRLLMPLISGMSCRCHLLSMNPKYFVFDAREQISNAVSLFSSVRFSLK